MRSPPTHGSRDQARQSPSMNFNAPGAAYGAVCIVCGEVMNEWLGMVGRATTLKSQPAHAVPALIRIDASHA
jgi:hypothetical protein